jgi:pimeloyl-ACP methyl ester carboxylesterase
MAGSWEPTWVTTEVTSAGAGRWCCLASRASADGAMDYLAGRDRPGYRPGCSRARWDRPESGYRWRLGLAEGEARYDELEKQLADSPVITVPTITLEGDANGAPHPDSGTYAAKFSGKYAHRTISGGVGHNLPQEAPQAFAEAIVDVGGS